MPAFVEYTPDGWRQAVLPPSTPQSAPPRVVVEGVWVGLDLGQSADYSAVCVVERHQRPTSGTCSAGSCRRRTPPSCGTSSA